MTLLDLWFEVEKSNLDATKPYEFWSINEEGMYLYMNYKTKSDFVKGVSIFIGSCISSKVPSILENAWQDKPLYVPFEEIKLFTQVEIEFEQSVSLDYSSRNPLVCVRGTCDKQCTEKKFDGYCLRRLPCTNKRPDWNIWSCKNPDFYDLLADIANFIEVCPHTDTLIVMFDFTPSIEEPKLNFDYCTGVHVRNNKITILENHRVKEMYREYNTKYPTQDRQIEDSISEPEENFYFTF